MRVLIDYRPALRNRTGVGEFVHHLVTELATADLNSNVVAEPLEITAFCASWKDRLADAPAPKLPPRVHTVDRRIPVALLNLAWHRANWPPVETLTGGIYDVVHSPHPLLLPTRSAAQVITIHDLDFLDHTDRTTKEVLRDYPTLVRRHARRADHIVVPSRYTAGEVERRLGVPADAISLCWNGAPSWSPRDHIPHPGHLLFVGTVSPRKNVVGLLDAYQQLVTDQPNSPDLVLVGVNPPDAPWRDRVTRPPLLGRVRCTGYVDRQILRTLYADARVLVAPSFDEGFGLPVLEAMTIGVPVVASNRGALPEVLGDAGLLVDPTDSLALASAIGRMLNDEGLAKASAARGVERARSFSWRTSAQALQHAYRKAVEARASTLTTDATV